LQNLNNIGLKVAGKSSLFNIPGMHLIPELILRAPVSDYQLKKSYKRITQKASLPITLPNSVASCLNIFDGIFLDRLFPRILPRMLLLTLEKPLPVTRFRPEEDCLLFQGLIQYGCEDLVSIKYHFLPTKTFSTIKARLRSLNNRNYKYSSNPMKVSNNLCRIFCYFLLSQ
jgi:hypothetical protein